MAVAMQCSGSNSTLQHAMSVSCNCNGGSTGGTSSRVKIGGLWKRSQGLSRFTKHNYKHRVFILTEQALSYYGGTVEVSIYIFPFFLLLHVWILKLSENLKSWEFSYIYLLHLLESGSV